MTDEPVIPGDEDVTIRTADLAGVPPRDPSLPIWQADFYHAIASCWLSIRFQARDRNDAIAVVDVAFPFVDFTLKQVVV